MAGYNVRSNNSQQPKSTKNEVFGINNIDGLYIGTVTDNSDSLYTGRIKVRIPEFGSDPNGENSILCLLSTPFGGITSVKDSTEQITSDQGSPRSYGMWPQPPEVGSRVVVAFMSTMEQGVLLGSLITKDKNYMMGGNASSFTYGPNGEQIVMPSTEKNPYDNIDSDTRPTDTEKLTQLVEQGLQNDWLRGHSQSSARRESPSKVFGITTLGGHTFTLDDGNDKGSSKNIRIRTRGGAQILMDDSTGTVFINNHAANAYIEMDAEGKIDIYSQSDISVHAEGDYNVHAKGSINMQADVGINMKSTGTGIKLQSSVGNIDIHSAQDLNLQADANGNLLVSGNYKETAGRIDMNGPEAASATDPELHELTENTGIKESVSTRVPEHHPWKGATGKAESVKLGEGNK